jgi:hypothetical protein
MSALLARLSPENRKAAEANDNDDPTAQPPEASPTLITSNDRREIIISSNQAADGDEVIATLAELDHGLYQRSGYLCRIANVARVERTSEGERPVERPCIVDENKDSFPDRVARLINFVRPKEKNGETVYVSQSSPPKHVIAGVLARREYPGVRVIESVVEAPMMRADGSILDAPGYDAKTGLYYAPSIDFGQVPSKPARADALEAHEMLLDAIADFPFASPAHQSAAIAALLTLFARHAIGNAPVPLMLIDKNVRGAGAGLLVDVIALIATGRPAPLITHPDDDAEMRKVLTTHLLAGASLVNIDNVNGNLGCASLDALLTGRTWDDRILGESRAANVEQIRITIFATANNAQIQADTARRTLHIRMESPAERPEERTGFRHPHLREHVITHRAELARAALTVLRAYVVAGRPAQTMPAWGSYEEWSAIVRGALVWLGRPDPAETRTALAENADTERRGLALLLDALADLDPRGAGLTAAEIIARAQDRGQFGGEPLNPALHEAVEEIAPGVGGRPPTAKSLGRRLTHMRRRVVGDRYLDRIETRDHVMRWTVRMGLPK